MSSIFLWYHRALWCQLSDNATTSKIFRSSNTQLDLIFLQLIGFRRVKKTNGRRNQKAHMGSFELNAECRSVMCVSSDVTAFAIWFSKSVGILLIFLFDKPIIRNNGLTKTIPLNSLLVIELPFNLLPLNSDRSSHIHHSKQSTFIQQYIWQSYPVFFCYECK